MQEFWYTGINPTADLIITKGDVEHLEVLLIKRADGPESAEGGKWALPGGFHETDAQKGEAWVMGKETAPQAAARELEEETGLSVSPQDLTYIACFDALDRDPRNTTTQRSVSNVFHYHLSPEESSDVVASDDASDARWIPIKEINTQELAFDHKDMLVRAKLI